ncbi:hypothetical protein Q0Z83_036160 [Actinoplanes sichuanensis]|uniref:Uncharacterized protein n=1 Tax=Actinoplanes sichuanensis TaxID=512349 RepID=A0ABW4AVT3_9ACTN|nr:hypothetical protein [Actinoplanes sichuanensis]BEL05425.1 hypothetical protein Q0Z83_036160 [Actinoplanes sichuanensis]
MLWGQVVVFQGRTFVTRGRFTTGVAVVGDASGARLGDVILRLYALDSDAYKDDGASWRTFCEDIVGVPVRRFSPEKSARVYLDDGTWHAVVDPFGPEATTPAVPAADVSHRLGAMVRRVLDEAEPQWPAIRQVIVATSAIGRLIVMPIVRGSFVGPVCIAEPDTASLLAAVRAALPESDREWGESPAYAEALPAAGVDRRLLNGCATVHLEELSTGSVRLTGVGSALKQTVVERTWLGPADDYDAVCAAAVRMIADLPVEHLPPGTPAGVGFGIKMTWLAVRGSTVEQVAAAIGLTGGRETGWDEGVEAARGDQVFVSPPTGGWIFVVNAVCGFDGSSVASLSAQLRTEVQYFGNHRVSDYAEWALAVDGRLVRHVYCSETSESCEETGTPTPVEIELGFSATEPGGQWADQDDVMRVAAAWSIDPNALSVIESSLRPGLVGHLA